MPYIFQPGAIVQVDAFTMSYVETALWATTDNANDSGGDALDENFGPEDIAPDTLARMIEDCRGFQASCGVLIEGREEEAGQDFWLTRERHGAGFWDGRWPGPAGTVLADAAHAFGGFNLYVGDDNLIHGS